MEEKSAGLPGPDLSSCADTAGLEVSKAQTCVIIYLSFTVDADSRGELYLKRTEDLGRTLTTITQNIFSFGYIGGFLFTSVMEKLVRHTYSPKTHARTHT